MWKHIKTRRSLPPEGRYIVTREFKSGLRRVMFAELMKYKNKKHWVRDGDSGEGGNAYPYDNVIAYQPAPEPFDGEHHVR